MYISITLPGLFINLRHQALLQHISFQSTYFHVLLAKFMDKRQSSSSIQWSNPLIQSSDYRQPSPSQKFFGIWDPRLTSHKPRVDLIFSIQMRSGSRDLKKSWLYTMCSYFGYATAISSKNSAYLIILHPYRIV